MEGIVYHHTYTRQPTSLTAARGIKRRADDEDPQPEPEPRRVTGMMANIPQYLWACGSNVVSGFLNLFKTDNGFTRRAPPPGTPMPTTHIEGVATDHSGRKRRKILPPDFEESQPSEMSGQRRADNAPRAPSPPRFGYYPPERPITAPRPVVPYNITSSFRDTEEKRRKRLKWYHDYYSDTAIERRNRAKRARKPQDGIVPSYKSARNDEDNNKRASIRDSQVDTLLSKVQNLQGESFAQKAAVRTARVKREREEAAEREAAELLRQRDAALIAEQEAEAERVRAEAERHRRFEEEEAAFWEEHGDAVLQQMKEEEEAERKRAAQEAASLTAEEAEIERRRAAAEAAIHEDIVVELPEKVRERLQESLAKARHDRDEITTLGPFPLGKLSFMRTLASDNGTESWLDDDTVNAWFHAIVEAKHVETSYVKGGHQPPAFTTLNTGWFTRAQKEGPKSLSRWMRRAGIAGDRILGCDRVFLPINMGSHWTLLIINGRDRSIEYLDSLGGDGGQYFTLAREILKAELGDAYLAGEWTDLKRNRSSAQSNMSDCGVFTCFNGLAAAQGRQYKEVTAKKMPLARQMLAGLLINGGFVGEFYL